MYKNKFQPRKDQRNGTSKNDLKTRAVALNQKNWAFIIFFPDFRRKKIHIKRYKFFLITEKIGQIRISALKIKECKEFQPQINQENGTSKNDLKTHLGALNQKI